jgi:hypothetical protein
LVERWTDAAPAPKPEPPAEHPEHAKSCPDGKPEAPQEEKPKRRRKAS